MDRDYRLRIPESTELPLQGPLQLRRPYAWLTAPKEDEMNGRSCSTALLGTAIAALLAAPPALAKDGGYLEAKGVVASNAAPGAGGGPAAREVASQSGDAVFVALPTDGGTALARVDPNSGGRNPRGIPGASAAWWRRPRP
jgi:hypothetical protein